MQEIKKTKTINDNSVKNEKRRQKNLSKAVKAAEAARVRSAITEKKHQEKLEKKTKKSENSAAINKKQKTSRHKPSPIAYPSDFWSTLDNAGLIFPATATPDMNSLFRLSAVMKAPVNTEKLQQAINDVAPRFPTITCGLKQGIFWYFLEPPTKPITVLPMDQLPCARMQVDSRNSMIRVFYYNNEIAVEFFHTATDGTGAVFFFNSLLHRYISLVENKKFEDYTNCANHLDIPKPYEIEDSYQTMDILKQNKPLSRVAFHLKGSFLLQNGVRTIKGVCDSSQVKELASKHGATVGQLLTAVLIFTMQKMKKKQKGKLPVILSLAANLRPYYSSKTLRNFVSYMDIDAFEFTEFEDILKTTIEQCKDMSKKEFFDELVTLNVRAQHNFFVKLLPLPLKNLMLKFAFELVGERTQSMMLSNLGKINAPEFFNEYISRYEFGLGGSRQKKVNVSCCSFNNHLTITFSSLIKERDFETIFFQKLSSLGIDVCVESNMGF